MGDSATRAAIESRFLTMWTADATNLRTPVALENVPYLPVLVSGSATGSLPKPPNNAAWVRLTIREGESRQIELRDTTPLRRSSGVIIVQIFVPRGTGTDASADYADLLPAIFERKQFGGITTRTQRTTIVGDTEHWWQRNVSFPYQRDQAAA